MVRLGRGPEVGKGTALACSGDSGPRPAPLVAGADAGRPVEGRAPLHWGSPAGALGEARHCHMCAVIHAGLSE